MESEGGGGSGEGGAVEVGEEVPEHQVRLPAGIRGVGLNLVQPLVEGLAIDVATAVGILRSGWFAQDYLLSLDASLDELVHCILRVAVPRVLKLAFVGIVGCGVALIVVLDIVEVNGLACLRVDCSVGTAWGVAGGEVRGLRGVGDDVEGELGPQFAHEEEQPVLTRAVAESLAVFEINVHAVGLIGTYIGREVASAVDGVEPLGGWELRVPEGTDEQFDSGLGVEAADVFLCLFVGAAQCGAEVVDGVCVDFGDGQGGFAGPEGVREVVVEGGRGQRGYAHLAEGLLGRPPGLDVANVGKSDGLGSVHASHECECSCP
jgi:xanthosine utilization system XapX-like protein